MRADEIQQFLTAYHAGMHSEADHQRFVNWLRTASPDELEHISEEALQLFKEPRVFNSHGSLIDRIENAINQFDQQNNSAPHQGRIVKLRTFTRLLVAATVVGLVIAGAWLLFNNDGEVGQISNAGKEKMIVPGGNKAVLTLSDGRTILLDSAANGNLANQGNTTVIKLDGQLSYSANGGQDELLYNAISTPKGGQYQLILADGSKVWLNAASSLRFPTAFHGRERVVELNGEGYFEIAKDPARKFKVKVNDMEVEVLGTHFNINSYHDEALIKTTLLEGSVKITHDNESRMLKPGQQGTTNTTGELNVLNDVDIDQVMAWKNGAFNFNNADIETIMRQLSRWYDVEVEYKGQIPRREFGGEIQRDLNLSEVLKLLEKNNVHFKIEGKKLVVMP